jgi:hypothetical protein
LQPDRSAHAVESGVGFYMLGAKGSMAGYTPPPGTYVIDYTYLYSGNMDLSLLGGVLVTDIQAKAYLEVPTVLWVAPQKVLGGNVGFGVLVPFGRKDVQAAAELNLPPPIGITLRGNLQDQDTAFGDPVAMATIGWNRGNWHWNLGVLINMPLGFWERRNLANIGFNRWGVDTTAAVTWLDPKMGLEISGAAGFTFNFENPDTDYKSGTEFHFEYAIMKNLSKEVAIGVTGYHYQQVTGDSGAGARLGAFEGRVSAIGPIINYNFVLDKTPVSTSVRWIHEFDAKNRAEGDVGLLTVTFPVLAHR